MKTMKKILITLTTAGAVLLAPALIGGSSDDLGRRGRRTIATGLVGLAAFAAPAPARAGETDADQRYHAAYVLEVVEGKVDAAAREYIELMDDADAPARIRSESRFRFAVCTVLLGRSDEARLQLGALIKDTEVPQAVRDRAREYLEAIQNVGIGKEVDKRMQELVFELGRAEYNVQPSAYRDFEVIGKPAIPFLRSLLEHTDARLRYHAYRLLVRMGEPGMIELFPSAVRSPRDGAFAQDLRKYLETRPDDLATYEDVLSELDAQMLELALVSPLPRFSVEFVRSLPGRGVSPVTANNAARVQEPGTYWDLLIEWTSSDDPDLAQAAVDATGREISKQSGDVVPEGLPRPGQVLALTKAALGGPWQSTALHVDGALMGLRRLAAHAEVAEVLQALEVLVGASEGWTVQGSPSPLENGLGYELAGALDGRKAGEIDAATYHDLLKRWIAHMTDPRVTEAGDTKHREYFLDDRMTSHLHSVLTGLDPAAADEFATWLIAPDRRVPLEWTVNAMNLSTAEEVSRVVAVLETLQPAMRAFALDYFHGTETRSWHSATALAELTVRLVPRIVEEAFASMHHGERWQYLRTALQVLPAGQRTGHLLAVIGATAKLPENDLLNTAFRLLPGAKPPPEDYYVAVIVPALDALHAALPNRKIRRWMNGTLIDLLEAERAGTISLPAESRAQVIAFLRENLDGQTVRGKDDEVAAIIDELDLARLAVICDPNVWNGRLKTAAQKAGADELAKTWLDGDDALSRQQISFVQMCCSEEVVTATMDRLLTETPTDQLGTIVGRVAVNNSRGGASLEVIEATLERVAADPEAPMSVLSSLARFVGQRRPTPSLVPIVRRLLASERYSNTGVELATRLGLVELVPDLVQLMDSLHPETRESARKAIDGILELERLRKEARDLPGGESGNGPGRK